MKCPNCGVEQEAVKEQCSQCNYDLQKYNRRSQLFKNYKENSELILILLVAIAGILIFVDFDTLFNNYLILSIPIIMLIIILLLLFKSFLFKKV